MKYSLTKLAVSAHMLKIDQLWVVVVSPRTISWARDFWIIYLEYKNNYEYVQRSGGFAPENLKVDRSKIHMKSHIWKGQVSLNFFLVKNLFLIILKPFPLKNTQNWGFWMIFSVWVKIPYIQKSRYMLSQMRALYILGFEVDPGSTRAGWAKRQSKRVDLKIWAGRWVDPRVGTKN